MTVDLKVPAVGESIKEVLIGDWLKSEGEHVDRDEDVVVIETDKATVEVAAPESGTLTKVLKRTGDKAAVGDVIGYLDPGESNIKQPEKEEAGARSAHRKQETPQPEAEKKDESDSGQEALESPPLKALDTTTATRAGSNEQAIANEEPPQPRKNVTAQTEKTPSPPMGQISTDVLAART